MKRNIPRVLRAGVFLPPLLAGLVVTGCLSAGGIYYQAGVYEGTGQGYRGAINVRVWVSEGGVEDIEILEHREDGFATAALEELRELALETGATELDAVSGATVSSEGFLSALEDALRAAQNSDAASKN